LVFIVGKVLSIGVGCMVANFKTRSAFLVATSLVAMGEFSFVVAKQALDANVITGSLYASIIGAAVITMVTLPVLSKNSSKIFDAIVKRLPKKVFETMDRIENSRLEARRGVSRSNYAKKIIKRQLMYLVIDVVYIVFVLLLANVIDDIFNTIAIVLFIATVILIIPAIIHLVKRLRNISEVLACTIPQEGGKNDIRRAQAFKFFRNISEMVTFLILLGLILPLLPRVDVLPISPIGIIMVIVIIVWFAWDTINARYDKVSGILSRSFCEIKVEESDEHQSH
jgi:CPA2 family monovalent cation:H+ antiporter-2